ncbi:MAG: PLP-dependent transferase, partial [Erythrobacter sp.]|nr:PLP-dependent transferase [Erythrobacter sp.]
VVMKGLETLSMRAHHQSASAVTLGEFLAPRVGAAGGQMRHPGLPGDPGYALAQKQMEATGPIFAFDVGTRARAFAVLDALELIDISNNIGDSRSLMCHPASTTHAGLNDEARAEMGVTEGLLRINVGLEDIADITEDMDRALKAAGI